MSDAWREFEESSSKRVPTLLAIGGVGAFGFLVFFHFFGRDLGTAEPPATAAVEGSLGSSSASPAAQPDRAPVASSASNQAHVRVFECVAQGQRVISDHPCGPDATSRTLVVDHPDPASQELANRRLSSDRRASRNTGSAVPPETYATDIVRPSAQSTGASPDAA